MNRSTMTLALAALTFAPAAFAGVLELEAGSKQVNGVTISSGGKMIVEGRATNLVTVGAGVRKRFGFIAVYVGELLVSDSSKYACESDHALDSIKNLSGLAIKLTFQRSIGMTDLEKAFTDGADNNDVDPNNTAVKGFMNAIRAGGDIPNGAKLAFTGEILADGTEAVTYENAKGVATTIKGSAGFVRSIFSLWLGNTGSDDGLKGLKDKFTNCQI